jgi:hypothetical protein
VILGLCVLTLPAGVLANECAIYNVYSPAELQRGRSLSVGEFSVEGHNTTPDKMRALQRFGADRLRAEIIRLGYFSSVSITQGNTGGGSDLHLAPVIKNLDEGSGWRRMLGRTGAATVRVTGALRVKSGGLVFDFECEGAELGGLPGGDPSTAGRRADDGRSATLDAFAGGLMTALGGSPTEPLLRTSFEKFAVSLARNIRDVDIQRQKQLIGTSKPRTISEGTTVRATKAWRQRARSAWTPAEHSKEVNAFVVETQIKDGFRVHALWLGESAYASNTLLNAAAFGQSKVELADGLLPDMTPARALMEQPGYLIGVTFESGASDGRSGTHEGPFIWDGSALLKATYLVRKGDPARAIAASDLVRLPAYLQRRGSSAARWRNVPVIFAFPVVRADGTALVQSLTDEIELRTTIGDRQAVATFRLADLELTDVTELQRRR